MGLLKIRVDFESGFAALFNGDDVFDRECDHNSHCELAIRLALKGSERMAMDQCEGANAQVESFPEVLQIRREGRSDLLVGIKKGLLFEHGC